MNIKGAISRANPELYQKLVEWASRWKARLEKEAAKQKGA